MTVPSHDGRDRRRGPREDLREGRASPRRDRVLGPRGRGLRPARPERRRQVHHRADPRDADARRRGPATVAGHDVATEPARCGARSGTCRRRRVSTARRRAPRTSCSRGGCRACAAPDLERRADELLEIFGLGDKANALVKTYSGGMKRRLDVAMGLVHRPQVLFLDEPTTGLDPEARAAMWEELERLAAAERLTILLTTHYLEEADRLARHVAIVSRGKVVVEGSPEDAQARAARRRSHGRARRRRQRSRGGGRARLEGVHEVTPDGRRLHLRVDQGAQAVPVILAALDAAGAGVAAVTVSRPSLDDVYLHHTGRDFRAATTETASEGRLPDAVPLRPRAPQPLAAADLDRRDGRPTDVLAPPLQPALPSDHGAARVSARPRISTTSPPASR